MDRASERCAIQAAEPTLAARAEELARRCTLGTCAVQEELSVVTARAGQQRRSAHRGMPLDGRFEVGACAVVPAGDGAAVRGAKQAVHRAGVARERAPLNEAV